MLKRIALFLATNLLILLMLSIAVSIAQHTFGLQLNTHMGHFFIAAVIGFGGAFLSLFISKWVAKWTTGAKVITQPQTPQEAWLLQTVQQQATKAGIKMPEVAIYPSPEINAFATGHSRNNSLVAVSQGLLQAMSRDEAEAVLAHEVSHVANGDMVTLTLLQGVINTFVIFFARLIGSFVDRVIFKNEDGPGIGFFVVNIIAQIVLGVLASTVVMAFSRYREYRADLGGAQLSSKPKMIAALKRLQQVHEQPTQLPEAIRAFGIKGKIGSLFSSHPPLDKRIAALESSTHA